MGAFYSRNKSYSRSYNAECAEEEGRFPATRFKQVYGIDPRKVVSAGEWHHVGKYANKVDYYDIEDVMAELAGMAYVDRMAAIGKGKFKQYWEVNKMEYLRDRYRKKEPEPLPENYKAFKKAIVEKCKGKGGMLKAIVENRKIGGGREDQYVEYGSRMEEDIRLTSWGSPYSVGMRECSAGGWLTPFDLSPQSLKKIVREISLKKFAEHKERMGRISRPRYSFNRQNVHCIVIRRRDRVIQNNSLQGCNQKEWLIAARILEKQCGATYNIAEDGRVNISMPTQELA